MKIKSLFDPAKDIYRTIEKVITYSAGQEARLKAEITEYVVTESIEEQFEKLLLRMQMAMDAAGENEVGVWVSGFYGSGKSSFTKYLGLALDDSVQIDGVPFLKYLQDRLNKPQTKALLSTVAKRYPAAVVFLDLASEMLAGATMEEVSSVLYYKVLHQAGYSRNLKVAALERRLRKDGRYDEFTARIEAETGMPWRDVQNDPLAVDSLIPEIAHDMYPELFRTPTAFTAATADFVRFEPERIQEMIDILREATGKRFIVFIIDEAGQYVGWRQNLILNLDGLAKNLKHIGQGQVWIIGTAQQTLTEDDPRAALNSPELYKLKDRFPIQIDLESSDIKEICYRRLLGKSPQGEKVLGTLFDGHGQALRHNTRLEDARYYDADFDRTLFTNLYPFLPAHFDILLHLLGALAKSTGGIGLRSAIKVVQDILIQGPDEHTPVAEQPVGWLATMVTLYDTLEKDICSAYPSIHRAVDKALIRFPDQTVHQEVAKTVAVLQILDNMPVTAQNVTSLMHPAVTAASRRDEVDAAIREMMADPSVPFGEREGRLCFFSEKLNAIDQERTQIPLRSIETRRILNEALREAFTPLPSTRLDGTLVVTSGLKAAAGATVSALAGERNTVQTVVEFADEPDYATVRTRLVDESRERANASTVFLPGRTSADAAGKVAEIYRCREIVQRHRNDPDREVKEYCVGQSDRAARLAGELQHLLKRSLAQGSFIFRGQTTAVESLDHDVLEAARTHLASVAAQVFDRYAEAPVRAETALAERFLRAGNLRAVISSIDPLGLVQLAGGVPSVHTQHKALTSIRDYVERNGTVEGRRLLDHFSDAPFGWSPDTLRYLIAALLVAGEIKLRVSGHEVTVNGQQAIDALRTNNTFKPVGVALRDGRPPPEVLARAAQRLAELTGDQVLPLEDEISKVAVRHFPRYQQRFGPLAVKLESLGLPGAEAVRSLSQELADVLLTDASDAPQRLGGEESALYDHLTWAARVDSALQSGLEPTVRELQRHRREIEALPDSGVPGRLRSDLADDLALLGQRLAQPDFHLHGADLNSALTAIEARTRDAAAEMAAGLAQSIKAAQQALQRLPDWPELTQEEQSQQLAQLDEQAIDAPENLTGLRQLLTQEYVVGQWVAEGRRQVEQLGRERRRQRLEAEKARACKEGKETIARSLTIPPSVTSAAQLEALIHQLQALKAELTLYSDIRVTIRIED